MLDFFQVYNIIYLYRDVYFSNKIEFRNIFYFYVNIQVYTINVLTTNFST